MTSPAAPYLREDDTNLPRGFTYRGAVAPVAITIVVALALVRGVNPVFAVAFVATIVAVFVAIARPFTGLQLLLIASIAADELKRLLLLAGAPSKIEWFGTIALPDLILLGVVAGALFQSRRPVNMSLLKSGTAFAVIALFSWITLRTIWTAAPVIDAVGKWKLTMPYLLLFFVAPYIIDSEEKWERLLTTLLAAVAISAWYGIWQGVFGMSAFEERWLNEGYTALTPQTVALYGVFRPFSTFSDSGAFAYTLAICLTGAIMLRRLGMRRWWNSWISVAAMSGSLLLTVVRSGWLLLLIGMVAVSRATRRQRRWILGFALGGALLAAVALAGGAATANSRFVARSLTLGTYGSRLIGYANLFQMGIIGFVSGRGVSSMPSGGKRLSGSGDEELVAHDFFTETLYEIGWVGVVCWIGALVGAVRGRHDAEMKRHIAFLRFLVVGVPIIAALFGGGPMESRPLLILLWCAAGLLVAQRMPARASTATDGEPAK